MGVVFRWYGPILLAASGELVMNVNARGRMDDFDCARCGEPVARAPQGDFDICADCAEWLAIYDDSGCDCEICLDV